MIERLLHLLPYVHFFSKWEDCSQEYAGHDRQMRRCTVCNKKEYSLVQNT